MEAGPDRAQLFADRIGGLHFIRKREEGRKQDVFRFIDQGQALFLKMPVTPLPFFFVGRFSADPARKYVILRLQQPLPAVRKPPLQPPYDDRILHEAEDLVITEIGLHQGRKSLCQQEKRIIHQRLRAVNEEGDPRCRKLCFDLLPEAFRIA